MGKSDLNFLQDTLNRIYIKNGQIVKLKERKDKYSKEIKKSEQIIKELMSFIVQIEEEEVGNISEKELIRNVSDVKNKVNLVKKAKKLHYHKKNDFFPTSYFFVACFVLVVGVIFAIVGQNNYYTSSPFDCENGEMIHGSKVLDGKDDCSNGHDEEEPFWSVSDAENYADDGPFIPCFGFSFCFPIFIIFLGYKMGRQDFDANRVKLENEVSRAETKINDAKMNLKLEKDRKRRVKEQKELEKQRQKNIQENKINIDESLELEKETFEEINRLTQQRIKLYETIKHLIPYSEYL